LLIFSSIKDWRKNTISPRYDQTIDTYLAKEQTAVIYVSIKNGSGDEIEVIVKSIL
jgi:hypothetical protein